MWGPAATAQTTPPRAHRAALGTTRPSRGRGAAHIVATPTVTRSRHELVCCGTHQGSRAYRGTRRLLHRPPEEGHSSSWQDGGGGRPPNLATLACSDKNRKTYDATSARTHSAQKAGGSRGWGASNPFAHLRRKCPPEMADSARVEELVKQAWAYVEKESEVRCGMLVISPHPAGWQPCHVSWGAGGWGVWGGGCGLSCCGDVAPVSLLFVCGGACSGPVCGCHCSDPRLLA